MNRTLKRILIAVIALVVVVGGVTVWYVFFYDQADKEFSQSDVEARLDVTTVPGSTADGVDGEWQIGGDSEVGYRVNEVINGLEKTANGRTNSITGSLTIAGTAATAGEFTVDMATFESSESRRDGQFRGRIRSEEHTSELQSHVRLSRSRPRSTSRRSLPRAAPLPCRPPAT